MSAHVHAPKAAAAWNTKASTSISTEKALMEQGDRSPQWDGILAVFTAICANGPVYTMQDSSVNRGHTCTPR